MIRAVTALQFLAERKIEEAIARGELDNLPGAGRPLDLDDEDPLWPEAVRMARRILKNADYKEQELGGLRHVRWSIDHRYLGVVGDRWHGGMPRGVTVAQSGKDLRKPLA
jgi:hypothetical protein